MTSLLSETWFKQIDIPDLVRALAVIGFAGWLVGWANKHKSTLRPFLERLAGIEALGLKINMLPAPENAEGPGLSFEGLLAPLLDDSLTEWREEVAASAIMQQGEGGPALEEAVWSRMPTLSYAQQVIVAKPLAQDLVRHTIRQAGLDPSKFGTAYEVNLPLLDGLMETPKITYVAGHKGRHATTLVSFLAPTVPVEHSLPLSVTLIASALAVPQYLARRNERWQLIVGIACVDQAMSDLFEAQLHKEFSPAIESGKMRLVMTVISHEVGVRCLAAGLRMLERQEGLVTP